MTLPLCAIVETAAFVESVWSKLATSYSTLAEIPININEYHGGL